MDDKYFLLRMPKNADERPEKTFYYERSDGTVFACRVKEAHAIHKSYKQYGVSDSMVFFNELQKAVDKQDRALAKLGTPSRQTKKWKEERKRIADEAFGAIKNAYLKDQKAAKGNFEVPMNMSGIVVGEASAHAKNKITNMLAKI